MALPLGFMESDISDSDSEASSSDDYPDDLLNSPHNSFIEAVIVNTNSMILRAGVPRYKSHSLSPTDTVFANRPSATSVIFNIPLVARAVDTTDLPNLADYLREAQLPNLPIRSLFRQCDVTCCDEDAGMYGWDHQFSKHLVAIDGR